MDPAGEVKIPILKHFAACTLRRKCDRSSGSGKRLETLIIGALKEKEKDNQYKLNRPMAIAIGLTETHSCQSLVTC